MSIIEVVLEAVDRLTNQAFSPGIDHNVHSLDHSSVQLPTHVILAGFPTASHSGKCGSLESFLEFLWLNEDTYDRQQGASGFIVLVKYVFL